MSAVPGDVLVRLEDVVKHFPVHGARRHHGEREVVHAIDGVSLEVRRGETLGIVGESGSGKSTLARCILRLQEVTAGRIVIDGEDITELSQRRLRPVRREMQMIFQDPFGALNPRRRVGSIIGDPLAIHTKGSGAERKRQVQELMELVGLNPEHFNRFPAEFSGGQRQRIGVARALALRPKLIICDEPVSALDVSIQAQILNLLVDLQVEFKLTYVFIAHDLSVVRNVSNRIAVMYLGKVLEQAAADDFYRAPRHPYSAALLSAATVPDPDFSDRRERIVLVGDLPSPIHPPAGCRFSSRCPRVRPDCSAAVPALESRFGDPPSHTTACFYPLADGEVLTRTETAGIEGPLP